MNLIQNLVKDLDSSQQRQHNPNSLWTPATAVHGQVYGSGPIFAGPCWQAGVKKWVKKETQWQFSFLSMSEPQRLAQLYKSLAC